MGGFVGLSTMLNNISKVEVIYLTGSRCTGVGPMIFLGWVSGRYMLRMGCGTLNKMEVPGVVRAGYSDS